VPVVSANGTLLAPVYSSEIRGVATMIKILVWIVVIIFIIGLLVVTGVLDLIF
jgi:hypothetical protein